MSKKLNYLLLLLPLLLQATVNPENVLAASCLKDYQNAYQKLKIHKAFVYAREVKTGKDRCSWNYGSDTPENTKKSALKDCRKYQLNAECRWEVSCKKR